MKRARILVYGAIAIGCLSALIAYSDPAWWSSRDVTDSSTVSDYAPLLLGQLKWMATNAYDEIEVGIPGGAGSDLDTFIGDLSPTNNYHPVNVGQLRYVGGLFYDRLIEEEYCTNYPWAGDTNASADYAIANIGQLKYVFDFDLVSDDDSDGMPDWWELRYFGDTNQAADGDYDSDCMPNVWEYEQGFNPTNSTDGAEDNDDDGLANSNEYWNSTSPVDSDTDSDGMGDGAEVANHLDPTNATEYMQLSFEEGFESNRLGKITALDPGDDQFGTDVAVDGSTAVIGAPNNNSYAGAAYVFAGQGTNWSQESKLTVASSDRFGHSVAIDGNVIVVGAYGNSTYRGAVYVFEKHGTNWVEVQKLTASDAAAYEYFGYDVAIYSNTIVVGARHDDGTGSAYVFERQGTNWSETAQLDEDAAYNDFYGHSVAIWHDTILVGAPYDGDNGFCSGSAHVFRKSGTNWVHEAKVLASDGAANDQLGCAVSICGDSLAAGAYHDDGQVGSVYVFERSGTNWGQETKLVASPRPSWMRFGFSVSLDGDTLVTGAMYYDGAYGSWGAAYVFERDYGTNWAQTHFLMAPDCANGDAFGCAVDIDESALIVGALGNDDGAVNAGSAYLTAAPVMMALPGTLDNQNGWVASPTNVCIVQTNVIHGGSQALELLPSASNEVSHFFAAHGVPLIWEDYYIQPDRWQSGLDPGLCAASAVAYYVDSDGRLVVYDGSLPSDNWVTLTNHEPIAASTWVRITTRQTFTNQLWAIWLDGVQVGSDLGFPVVSVVEYSAIRFYGVTNGSSYVDDISISTNEPAALDTDGDGLTNEEEQDLGTYPDDADSDDDGYDDGLEVSVETDPLDADSHPAAISGWIAYSGIQTGQICIIAVTTENSWSTNFSTTLDGTNEYSLADLPNLTNYWVKAYRDSNGNGSNDYWEATACYTSNPVYLTNDVFGTDMVLADPNTDSDSDSLHDWWEMYYFSDLDEVAAGDPDYDGLSNLVEYQLGTNPNDADSDDDGANDGLEVGAGTDPMNAFSFPVDVSGAIAYTGPQTGMIYVIVVNASNSWAIDHCDVLATTNSYSVTNVPNLTNYWIKAWRDTDGDQEADYWEASGVCTSNSVYVTNDVADMNVVLSNSDTDADGMSDYWELEKLGTIATTADGDPDADGQTNIQEDQDGTDPMLADTDGDSVPDGDDTNPIDATDSEPDGIPDDWEIYWFGDTTTSAGGATDQDVDGITDVEEYRQGTDPTRFNVADTENVTGLTVFTPLGLD